MPSPLKTTGRRATPDIEVRDSPLHGLGAFARRALPPDHRLGEYAGRRYSPAQAAHVGVDNALTYLFALGNGSMIDGADGGNATRHLNHSCAPNCVAYEEDGPDGKPLVALYTARAIGPAEELTIDYSLQVDDARAPEYACRCGAPNCRGTMAELP